MRGHFVLLAVVAVSWTVNSTTIEDAVRMTHSMRNATLKTPVEKIVDQFDEALIIVEKQFDAKKEEQLEVLMRLTGQIEDASDIVNKTRAVLITSNHAIDNFADEVASLKLRVQVAFEPQVNETTIVTWEAQIA